MRMPSFCRFHLAISGEIRTLEFAEVSVWRELRHHAFRGVLINVLETDRYIDFNGVILLSQILKLST